MATLTFNGRLPGVDCQPALAADTPAIRLDVAAFVGLAERGPLDVPVAVEDANQYRAIFGGDLALATDAGVPVYANLPGAVRAFFDNGGRRAVVVRVAGAQARPARWQVPCIRLRRPDGSHEPVHVSAAWPGMWSNGHAVGTQLVVRTLGATGVYGRPRAATDEHPAQPGQLHLSRDSLLAVAPGDLLRVDPVGVPGKPPLSLYLPVIGVDLVHGVVTTGAEVPFQPGGPGGPVAEALLGSDALDGLPDELDVRTASLLRFDLLVRTETPGATELLERWPALDFNLGAGRSWPQVLQPAADDQPDQGRSLLLRTDRQVLEGLAAGDLIVPIGMDPLTVTTSAPAASSGVDADSGRDGLDAFDPVALFLDDGLLESGTETLLGDADQLSVLAADPRALRGIHSLIGVAEMGLLSAPDAIHIGWSPAAPPPIVEPEPEPEPRPPEPPELPDWSDFRDCQVATPPAEPPQAAPPHAALPPPDQGPVLPVLHDPAGYDPAALLTTQAAMIRLAAARGDVFTILGVPRHFDTAATLSWREALAAGTAETRAGRIVNAPLSYAGFWHPWVRVPEPTTPELAPLREQPPEGAVAGMVAARELARGVWVAPANVPLRGLVGLARTFSAEDTVRLFNAGTNLLAAQPGAIRCTSAHTLSGEPTLLQVSVRRLIMLLRRIALREGNRYVFATNTAQFRQLVLMRFERLLATLTRFGALAAYRVSTQGDDSPQLDADNGRLIVSLQVAPTIPIEFITITLIRSGEGLLDVEVG